MVRANECHVICSVACASISRSVSAVTVRTKATTCKSFTTKASVGCPHAAKDHFIHNKHSSPPPPPISTAAGMSTVETCLHLDIERYMEYVKPLISSDPPWPLIRNRNIPTERLPLVDEIQCELLWIEGCHVVSAADPLRSLISVF
jgi:hypothetical protein